MQSPSRGFYDGRINIGSGAASPTRDGVGQVELGERPFILLQIVGDLSSAMVEGALLPFGNLRGGNLRFDFVALAVIALAVVHMGEGDVAGLKRSQKKRRAGARR